MDPFAFLKNFSKRHNRPARKSKPIRRRPLSLLHLEDRVTPTTNIAPVYPDFSFSVVEDSLVGTVVGTAAATDDAGQTLSYAITGGNTANAFAIDANGLITVSEAVLDFEAQPTYTLTVVATDDGSPTLSDTATVTVNLINVQTLVSINDVSVTEFNNGTFSCNFTVTSSAAINKPFSLLANTISGNATAGSDFEPLSDAPVVFSGLAAGETQQLTVWVSGDTAVEADEMFAVLLTGGGNDVTIIDPAGLGTIVNDDTATFTVEDVSVSESDGSVTFVVSLSLALDATAKVNISFANLTTNAADFNHAPLQVTFPANSTAPQSVTLAGLDDIFAETTESFTANLSLDPSTPLTGYAVDLSDGATVTIADNDSTVTLAAGTEDVANPAGYTVSSVLGAGLGGMGMAVVAVDNTGGRWQYTTNGTTWLNLSANAGRVDLSSAARLLNPTYKVRFLPDSNYNGTVAFVYRVWDRTSGTAGATVDLSGYSGTSPYSGATSSARLTINPSNDAPELLFGMPYLTPVAVGSTNPAGDTVAAIAGNMITDHDAGNARGIAVTSLTGTLNGTWQYSLNAGSTWQNVGAVSNAQALLLSETDMVRFVPKNGFAGSASMYFRAWDGTNLAEHGSRANTGTNGGKTAFSWITKTATVVVTNNNAPTLSAGTSTLTSIDEGVTSAANTGNSVTSAVGPSVTDPDAGALTGIAVVSIDNTNGSWQYSTNNGASWVDISFTRGGVVDVSAQAVMLRDVNLLRFVPKANFAGTSSFTYRAWDRSIGTVGWDADLRQPLATGGRTAFSAGTRTAQITVNGINDAPVLDNSGAPTLTQASSLHAPGDTVASLVNDIITDPDAGAVKGIAVTALTGVNGVWEYSLDGGAHYLPMGAVSASSALLLREGDRVRFRPTVSVYTGSATMTFRAWDQTTGAAGQKVTTTPNGGTTAFSTASETAAMYSYNDAPVLAAGSPVLPAVTGNSPAPAGQSVASFAGAFITDPDYPAIATLEGIAVTGLTGSDGTWQFSLDAGATWQAVGPVSWTSARLLREGDLVRFLPSVSTWVGAATMTYRAWDQTGATAGLEGTKVSTAKTGGKTPFSTGSQTVTVRSNNAPTFTAGIPVLAPVNGNSPAPAGQTVASFAGGFITDPDGASKGIAVTDLSGGGGIWQFSTDGGSSWSAVGPVSFTQALLLRDSDLVRFLPDTATYNGTVTITYRAWDQSGTTAGLQGTKVSTANNGDFYAFSTVLNAV